MTPQLHARASEVFLEAVEIPEGERPAFLDRACGSDPALRLEVDSLLRRDRGTAIVDQSPIGAGLRDAIRDVEGGSAPPPSRIGQYEILSLLGRGGMGTVYRARQSHPARDVALKVMSGAVVSAAMLRRFDFEARILARLQHPGIAQIYEAGVAEAGFEFRVSSFKPGSSDRAEGDAETSFQRSAISRQPEGVPFFAMELVEGRPLTAYAKAMGLSIRDRLVLLTRVCDAVQHAHQRGVIHRDLKPTNVLVATEPRSHEATKGRELGTADLRGSVASSLRGFPKVLDFGVARLSEDDSGALTLATAPGQLVGTLTYMSPEQAAGDPGQVDTRSDIYSLGVIAYELLAGRLPHDLSGRSLPDAARIIRDEAPARLGSIAPRCRGDIETIVAKALEKDKERRYASVSDFAADIERYLSDQPILARPPSAVYQLRKLVRRHRLPAALAAALLLVAVGFGLFSTYQATVIARERDAAKSQAVAADQARREAEEARRVSAQEALTADRVRDLLVGLFRAADPMKTQDRTVGIEEVLARGEELVKGELEGEPEVQAKLLLTLGQVNENLGNYERGALCVEQALAHFETLNDPDHAETMEARNSLAMARRAQGRLEEAEALLRELAPSARQLHGEQAEFTLMVQNNLALVLKDRRKYPEALALYHLTLGLQRGALGSTHRQTLITLDNIGRVHEALGQWGPAEGHYRESIEGLRVLYAAEATPHPDLLTALNNLANVLANQERLVESEDLHREALTGRMAALGDDHPLTLQSMNNLAFTLRREGELEEAETWMRRSLDGLRRRLGDRHMDTLVSLNNLANVLRDRGRLAEAEPMFREALAGFRAIVDEKHFAPSQVLLGLGECLTLMKRFEEAETTLLEAHEGLKRTAGEGSARTRTASEKLAALYHAWNKPDEAARWGASRQAAGQP